MSVTSQRSFQLELYLYHVNFQDISVTFISEKSSNEVMLFPDEELGIIDVATFQDGQEWHLFQHVKVCIISSISKTLCESFFSKSFSSSVKFTGSYCLSFALDFKKKSKPCRCQLFDRKCRKTLIMIMYVCMHGRSSNIIGCIGGF